MPFVRSAGAILTLVAAVAAGCQPAADPATPPNIVLIYTDDVGYGDISAYGTSAVETPRIDALAAEGLRFEQAYAPSATCTPSRYALLTGEYAWRRPGTGIARGDAPLVILPTDRTTLPRLLQGAGYRTGVVGKWHLGLGGPEGADWNGEVRPGPLEVGFDESYLLPATGDRVPTVFLDGYRVVGLEPSDPIEVSFDGPIGNDPTGRDNPELLTMRPSHGHDMTIVNGISRIGYMSGGNAARWVDEDIADTLTARAVRFIDRNADGPFFLFYSTHDIHVPRVPHPRFAGKSGLGPRGDVLLELDWAVGELVDAVERNGLSDRTLILFTSDNGPVVDDGYEDQAVELLGGHDPNGPLRGGKYSAFEAGTRVPFIVRWPGRVEPGISPALFSQVDLLASFAELVGAAVPGDVTDSHGALGPLLGEDPEGREYVIEHNAAGTLSIRTREWKYIEPSTANAYNAWVDIELGNDPEPQLYDLRGDPGETTNVASQHPDVLAELALRLEEIRGGGR